MESSYVSMKNIYLTSFIILLSGLSILRGHAYAQPNLNITASAQAESIYQDVATESGTLSLTTLSVNPQVNATYSSNTFSGTWSGVVTHLERENDTSATEDTFSEYKYSANWQAIDRYLVIQSSGALNYQTTNSGDYLLTDFVTNPDALSKTRSNQITGILTFENGNWLRAQGSASYSDTASERTSTGNTGLDNDSISVRGTLVSGERAKRLIWELSGNYQDTTRTESSQGDFISRDGDFLLDALVVRNWGIRLNASHEANQISSRTDSISSARQYSSYGAGITYRQSSSRYISLTANKSSSDLEEDDDNTFVGLDMAWALSSRSSISGSYGKRFYGESAAVKFNYNTKYFRSSFTYSEDVTNTSRLLANPENLGVFVCPVESVSIADCFQPASLSYVPSADEELLQITTQNLEYDDNIILRKGAVAQLGYQFSRVTLSLSWQYAEDDYLESDLLRRTYSGSANIAYQLGSYTNLTSKVSYANVAERGNDSLNQSGESDNWNSTVALSRSFGQNFKTSLSLSYIDKEGDLNTGGIYGANYTDRRVTLSATYTYK